jgi:hypothetical protein
MFGSRRGAASGTATLMMLVAFALIGGLMYWLNITAQSSSVAVAEEPENRGEAMTGVAISLDDLSAGPATYLDQEVQMRGVPIVSRLGNHQFWTQLTNESPFLVRVDPALFAQGLTIQAGAVADLAGAVRSMSDSVLDAWEADGSFSNDVNRIEAEFAEHYLDVTQLEVVSESEGDGA